jgi:phosphatidylserine decarboxylase
VISSVLLGMLLALLTTLPLAWKWQLGIARVARFVVILGALSGVLCVVLDLRPQAVLVWAISVAGAAAALLYRFYRDPERTVPEGQGVIASPAEGNVIYIREFRNGVLPASNKHGRTYALEELTGTPLRQRDVLVVGIAMSFLDVHVNRAPIGGYISLQRHIAGSFRSLRKPEMVFANERITTVIERDDLQVAMVQIASRLVRQIRSFVQEGQNVIIGQRMGVIRFGSQVDLVLPLRQELNVIVRPGDHVRAGQSVVATMKAPSCRKA